MPEIAAYLNWSYRVLHEYAITGCAVPREANNRDEASKDDGMTWKVQSEYQ